MWSWAGGSPHQISRSRSAEWSRRTPQLNPHWPNRTVCSYRPAVRFPNSCCRSVSALPRSDNESWTVCGCSERAGAAGYWRCCGTSPCPAGMLSRVSLLSSPRNQERGGICRRSGPVTRTRNIDCKHVRAGTRGLTLRGLLRRGADFNCANKFAIMTNIPSVMVYKIQSVCKERPKNIALIKLPTLDKIYTDRKYLLSVIQFSNIHQHNRWPKRCLNWKHLLGHENRQISSS